MNTALPLLSLDSSWSKILVLLGLALTLWLGSRWGHAQPPLAVVEGEPTDKSAARTAFSKTYWIRMALSVGIFFGIGTLVCTPLIWTVTSSMVAATIAWGDLFNFTVLF